MTKAWLVHGPTRTVQEPAQVVDDTDFGLLIISFIPFTNILCPIVLSYYVVAYALLSVTFETTCFAASTSISMLITTAKPA